MIEIIILAVAFLFLCVTAYIDIRTYEIPDWINFAALGSAIGLRLLWTVFEWNYSYVVAGIFGLLLFYILGSAMFYTGQWGGGDSKLLMAVGAFLGFELDWQSKTFSFLVWLIIMGAVYGFFWSAVLAFVNWSSFKRNIKMMMSKKMYSFMHKLSWASFAFLAIIAVLARNDKTLFLFLSALAFFCVFFFYLFIGIKSVENCCMLKRVEPRQLTEGDWVAKDVVVKGRKVCSQKDFGLTKSQIKTLLELRARDKIRKILIKTGIPFTPSFLLAFLMMLKYGNVLLNFFG